METALYIALGFAAGAFTSWLGMLIVIRMAVRYAMLDAKPNVIPFPPQPHLRLYD